MRTGHPRSLTSAASHSALLRSIITSPSLLVPLGMCIGERRTLLKRVGRSAQRRYKLHGTRSCSRHHAPSNVSGGFDSLRVHSTSNDRTVFRPPRARGHLARHAGLPPLCRKEARPASAARRPNGTRTTSPAACAPAPLPKRSRRVSPESPPTRSSRAGRIACAREIPCSGANPGKTWGDRTAGE